MSTLVSGASTNPDPPVLVTVGMFLFACTADRIVVRLLANPVCRMLAGERRRMGAA